MTQKTLSAFRSDGRGLFRFRTDTCCRRARISVWSAARSAKISMILCMPERVSGGDAKFQGFCDRWNKWEGQVAGTPKIPGFSAPDGVNRGDSHLMPSPPAMPVRTAPSGPLRWRHCRFRHTVLGRLSSVPFIAAERSRDGNQPFLPLRTQPTYLPRRRTMILVSSPGHLLNFTVIGSFP